jgi:ribonuclease J
MAFNFNDYNDDILFVPLGGSNEIGMNLNLYRYRGKWLMIDFGIGFANDYLPGVEVLVPDVAFLNEIRKDLVGLVLTHAHEDHIGAVPYLWEELQCPIYATPFTAAVLKLKMERERLAGKLQINEVQIGSHLHLDPFDLELISVTHSIPEMQAIAIRTEKGCIMHTGDWKLDPTPMLGESTNELRLNAYGEEGVLAIVCDSTNVFVEGSSGSESDVRNALTEEIRKCSERVVVTTFASNIARLESIILAAVAAGRRIVLAGRSLERMIMAAQDSGYFKDIPEMIGEKAAMDIPRNECLIICTGCQGEPRAALTRIAQSDHPTIRLSPKDAVIFSSRDIPGNEARIGYIQNLLVERGIEVITPSAIREIHVSGHPARAELARMYQMVRPHIAVPVHGEARHLHAHTALAKQFQIPETVEASNGAVILLRKGEAKEIGRVQSGYIAVDGDSLIPTTSPLFGQRRRLRDEGIIFVSLVLEQGDLVARPILLAPGCLDIRSDADFIAEIIDEIENAVEQTVAKKGVVIKQIEDGVRHVIRKMIKADIGKRPLIEIAIASV